MRLLLLSTLLVLAACDSAPPPMPAVDTSPPSIQITSPAPGDTLEVGFGATETPRVGFVASDDRGVAWIDLRLDGANAGFVQFTAPSRVSEGYVEFLFGATGLQEGRYALTLVARDAAGNATASAAQSVVFVNVPYTFPGGG